MPLKRRRKKRTKIKHYSGFGFLFSRALYLPIVVTYTPLNYHLVRLCISTFTLPPNRVTQASGVTPDYAR